MTAEMVVIQRSSLKLLLASRGHVCKRAVLVRRCVTFLASVRKPTCLFVCCKLLCPSMSATSSLVKCRLKSDTTINAAYHLVELGMPQTADDVQRLAENITSRNMNINVGNLCLKFKEFEKLEKVKERLLSDRLKNIEAVRQMKDEETELSEETEKLLLRGEELCSQMKQFMDSEYKNLRSQLYREVLMLPTQLHNSTPEQDIVLEEIGIKTEYSSETQTHIELGKKWKSLFFRPVCRGAYYLAGDLALMEHQLMMSASKLLRSCSFRQFICPDTVKSNVLEGCGMITDEVFSMEVDRSTGDDARRRALSLTGVSCPTFVAFLAATIIKKAILPLQLFAVGQSHFPDVLSAPGLFGVTRTSTVDVFGAGASLADTDVVFDQCLSVLRQIYTSLHLHCKFVLVGASGLKPIEAKRVDIYVWSAAFQTYFKSGELRIFGDIVSRRLGCRYDDAETLKYLHLVHGTLVRVPTVIAALIEQHQAPVLDLCEQSLGKSVVHL